MKKYFSIGILALVLASCNAYNVRTDYAPSVVFEDLKTYSIRTEDLKLNDIDRDRVVNEIQKQLQLKSFQESSTPDLIINIKAKHKKINTIHYPSMGFYGMWGWGFGMGMHPRWSSEHNEGSLVIDVVDAKTSKLIWQGMGEGVMVDSPKRKQKQIPRLVGEILKDFPPKGKAK